MRTINMQFHDEDLYYRFQALKSKLKCDTWEEFARKVIQLIEKVD